MGREMEADTFAEHVWSLRASISHAFSDGREKERLGKERRGKERLREEIHGKERRGKERHVLPVCVATVQGRDGKRFLRQRRREHRHPVHDSGWMLATLGIQTQRGGVAPAVSAVEAEVLVCHTNN